MKKQSEYQNPEIRKSGCFFLDHISFFERPGEEISESTVNEIYRRAVSCGLIKRNCFVGADKAGLLRLIGEEVDRPVADCYYIGRWYPDRPVEYTGLLAEEYHDKFKNDKNSQFLIDEYRTESGAQHFMRVAADGRVIYDSYPGSPTVAAGRRASTRLYYIRFARG